MCAPRFLLLLREVVILGPRVGVQVRALFIVVLFSGGGATRRDPRGGGMVRNDLQVLWSDTLPAVALRRQEVVGALALLRGVPVGLQQLGTLR